MQTAQGCAELRFIMENKSCEGIAPANALIGTWRKKKRKKLGKKGSGVLQKKKKPTKNLVPVFEEP